jgi:hypothetical protein
LLPNPSFLYSELLENAATSFEHLMDGSSSLDVVIIVLKAVSMENPGLDI